jgi:hypothetical protein
MGPNLEEAGGSDGVQSKGGRSALLGKKGGASLLMSLGKKRGAPRSPRLHAAAPPMPLPMGKKRGVPWSAHSCATVPPSAIVDVGEEGRSAAADGEEEGSAAAASRLINPRSGASPPSLSRSNGERLSWRSGEREREILDRVDEDGQAV